MSEQSRRRHGRIRRWLVRPLFWGLALAALLVFAANLVLDSAWVRDRAARLVEARAGRALNRSITIGDLRFELLPLTVELRGLVIGGRHPDEPPLAVVPRAVVDASLYWRNDLRLELNSVWLDEPAVTLIFDEQGSNVRGMGRRRTGPRRSLPLQFAVEELTISRGELLIDHQKLPLDLSARGLNASLWGEDEPQWRVAAQEVEVSLPRARPYLGTVAIRGRLSGRTFELLSARLAGPDFKVAAHGRMVFGRFERRGGIELAVETGTRLLERLGYLEGQLEGEFDFGGRVSWDLSDWVLQGAVASRSLRALQFPLERVQAVVNGDRERFNLEIQAADYAGGGLTGDVGVDLPRDRPPEVDMALELDAVDLDRLLADQGWPVAGVAAKVSGPFSYGFRWGQAERGTGWANLTLRRGADRGMPFRGSVSLLIEQGVLRTTAARLISGRQRLETSGRYDLDRKRGEFRFRLASDAIEELLPLIQLPALQQESLWRPTAGYGELDGTFRLYPGGPGLELRMDLAEVAARGAAADQLRGTLGIGPAGIGVMRLELLRPEAALIVTGSIPFEPPDGAPPAPFAVTVDAAGWPLEEARAWLPFTLPVSGPAYGALRLGGSLEALAGSAELEVRGGRLFELPADALGAELEFDGQGVEFRRLRLATAAGEVSAAGTWNRSSDGLALELESEPLDLAREPFSGWWTGALSGSLSLTGSAGGTLAEPRLTGRLEARQLALAGEPLGEAGAASLELDWQSGAVSAAGSLLGLVELDGGGLVGEEEIDLDLAVRIPDLAAGARLFRLLPEVEFGGSGSGRLRVAGRPRGPEPPRAVLSLDRLLLSHDRLVLTALEPARLSWTPSGLVIESLYLGEEGTGGDLFLAGEVGIGEPGALDLRMQASVDTSLAAPLLPAFELAGGRLDLLATIGGSRAAPQINGQAEVRGARLALGRLPGFSAVRGAVLLYPGRIVLDSVQAQFGGGTVWAGGTVQLPAPDRELSYRLQVAGEGVTLRYPEGWEMRGDAQLTVLSTEQGNQIRGAVTLDRALYLRRVQVGLTQLLQSVFQRRRLEVETIDEQLAGTQLNLLISGPGALRVRNNVANLEGDLDLALRGNLARPVLFGSVELKPGGKLQVGGSDYTVERGFLNFANPYRIEPVIDLTATTRRRDYRLSLSLAGTPERLEASLSSDPPLADLDVFDLLATSSAPRAGAPALGAEAFLYGQAASLVTERFNRLFDLDRFRVDPLTGSTGELSSARVTVGKQLSRDLLATYSYDPTETEQQILQLEWNVTRGLVLVMTQNGDGSYAVDARWEKSF